MEDINVKFKELYDRDLLQWVQSETSGYYKDTPLGSASKWLKSDSSKARDRSFRRGN